eukprot:TRINITY_DN806_c0_g3_i1.p1 TRINITY_DN806_c0_g3~~TRINITY_DN806_c0_g3_i1.p1  ORF type:complete len:712 (+),score=248.79 TRINITY_DN806_c0_g3_i1:22-2157(+)
MIDLSNEETLKSFENFIMNNLPNDAPKRELAEFVVTLFKNDMESDGTSFEEQCVKQLREFLGHDTQSFVSTLFKYIRNIEREKERREDNSPREDHHHSNRENREDYHSSRDSRENKDDHHSSRKRYDEERYDDKYQDRSPNRRNKRDNYNNNNNFNNNSNYKQGGVGGNKKYKNPRDNYDNNNNYNNNNNRRNNNFNNNPNNPNNPTNIRMNNNYQRNNYNRGKFCREFAEKGTCHRINCQYPHLNQIEIDNMRNYNNENQYHNKNNNNNINNEFQYNKNPNEIQSNEINNQNNEENNFNNQNFSNNLNNTNSENMITSDNPLDTGLSTNTRRNDGLKKKFQNNRNSLVVENIPRELNEIAKISEHFSKFGKIRNIKIIENKRKCIVDFSSNDQAFKAYRSSEAIMGNRFIKIRWNKNDQFRPNNISNNQEDPYTLNQVDQNNENDESNNNDYNNNNNEEDVANDNENNNVDKETTSYQQPSPSEESIKIAEYNKKKLNLINDILKMADEEKDPKKKEFLKQQAKELLQKTEITEKKRPIQEISETSNIPKKKVNTESRPTKRRMKLDNRCSCIKIENLPVVLSSTGKLFAHFKNYGTIEKVWIEGQDGFARFSTRGEAEYAFNNAFYSISGDQLAFSWHETKDNDEEIKDETKDDNENNENNDEASPNKEGNDSNEEKNKENEEVNNQSGSLSTNLETSTNDLNPNEDKD